MPVFDSIDIPVVSEAPVVPRRLILAHLDVAIQLLLTSSRGGEGVEELLQQLQGMEQLANLEGVELPFHALRHRYALSDLEANLVLVAASQQFRLPRPDRGPTVAEAVETVTPDALTQLEGLEALRPSATLRSRGLLEVWRRDSSVNEDDLLAHELVVPGSVVAYLGGSEGLGEGLSELARLSRPAIDFDRAYVPPPEQELLHDLLARWQETESQPLALAVSGDPGTGKSSLVKSLAGLIQCPVVNVDASLLAGLPAHEVARTLRRLYTAANVYGAWLEFDHFDAIEPNSPLVHGLPRALEEWPVVTFLVSRLPLAPSHGLTHRISRQVALEVPQESQRRALWHGFVAREYDARPNRQAIQLLAGRFQMSPAQIRNAVRTVARTQGGAEPSFQMLESAAYEQMRGDLRDLATVRTPTAKRKDLVLPEEETAQVDEIVRAASHRTELLHGWNFKQRYSYGTGVICLFSGEPGTGKTFCAEVIAGELGLDLYQIAVPQVVSKWVGETEKQISRIFTEAQSSKALLLFDEADSLFGSRTEVKTASDRYANMATNYLLQAIEAHEGIVVLTTNLEENLDSAAERRILFRVRFPVPDEAMRVSLWRSLIPAGAPLADDVDFEQLGADFELSGGYIKNAIIRAAYDALHRGGTLDMATLLKAGDRQARMTGQLVRRWE